MQCASGSFLGIASVALEDLWGAAAQDSLEKTQLRCEQQQLTGSPLNLSQLLWSKCSTTSDWVTRTTPPLPIPLPEGMVVDPLGPGATLGLLHISSFFAFGVNFDLKGDESRTLVLPAVDDVPAGHRWGKVYRLRGRVVYLAHVLVWVLFLLGCKGPTKHAYLM